MIFWFTFPRSDGCEESVHFRHKVLSQNEVERNGRDHHLAVEGASRGDQRGAASMPTSIPQRQIHQSGLQNAGSRISSSTTTTSSTTTADASSGDATAADAILRWPGAATDAATTGILRCRRFRRRHGRAGFGASARGAAIWNGAVC